MTETAKVLQTMLTENTGKHMLDSGGAYGRSWQQNKGRDFDSEPAATISVEEGFIDIRRSTYHFLKECLEFDQPMTDQFYEYAKAEDNLLPFLTLMEGFVKDWLGGFDVYGDEPPVVTGIYGEGLPLTINTYNHDSLLDQVIQYTYFELDKKGYVLLQIHGGCDVRGGYTAPKAFRCNIEAPPSIFSDGDATIVCRDSEHRWYVQDGSWEVDHDESADARFLTEFPIINQEFPFTAEMPENDKPLIWQDAKGTICPGPEGWKVVVWQDADGVHCPLCGEVLEVW